MFSSDTISADGVESPGEDMKLERHCRFYHEDGTIELLVENTMYKVHSYFLTRHSDWFRDRIENPREGEELSLPDGWEAVDGPDGAQVFVNYDLRETSFTRPIYPALPEAPAGVIPLPGTIQEEFDRLLSIFYPEDLNLGDLSTQEAWESVLKLATRWSFAGLRARAVRELDALVSPFDRLVLAKEYDIEEWVEDALRGLCMRSEPLTCDEWRCMSAEDTEFVAEAREHARMADDQSWEDLSAKVDQHVAAWKARNSSRPTGEETSDASSASGDGSEQSEQPSNANIQSTISIKQTLLEGENNASDLPTAVNEQDVAEGTIEDSTGSCEANVADEAAPPMVSDSLVSEPEEIEVASPESSLTPDNAPGEPQLMPIIAEDEEQVKGEVATTVAPPQASSAASAVTVTVPANTASVEATPLNETILSTTESVKTQPTGETEGSSTEVQRDAEGGETDEESVQVSHTTETTQSSGDDYEPLPSSPTTEISELSPTVITLEQQIHDAIDPPATPAVAEAPPIPQPSEEPSNAEPAPRGMNPTTVDEQQLAQARAEKEKAEAEAKAKEDAIWADFERESKAREEALAREAEERARVATPPPRPTSPRTWTFSMSRASSSVAVPTKQSPRSSLGPSAPNGSPNPAPGFWNKLAGGAGMSPPIRSMSPPARTRTLSVASLPGASFFSSLAAPLATPATVNAQDSTAPAAVASVGS